MISRPMRRGEPLLFSLAWLAAHWADCSSAMSPLAAILTDCIVR